MTIFTAMVSSFRDRPLVWIGLTHWVDVVGGGAPPPQPQPKQKKIDLVTGLRPHHIYLNPKKFVRFA
jgi:hypothetical protein